MTCCYGLIPRMDLLVQIVTFEASPLLVAMTIANIIRLRLCLIMTIANTVEYCYYFLWLLDDVGFAILFLPTIRTISYYCPVRINKAWLIRGYQGILNRDTATEAEVTSFLDDGGSRILAATDGPKFTWVETWNTYEYLQNLVPFNVHLCTILVLSLACFASWVARTQRQLSVFINGTRANHHELAWWAPTVIVL